MKFPAFLLFILGWKGDPWRKGMAVERLFCVYACDDNKFNWRQGKWKIGAHETRMVRASPLFPVCGLLTVTEKDEVVSWGADSKQRK